MNLKEILSRAEGTITESRIKRLNDVGINESDKYVDRLEDEMRNLEERIEECIDISARTDVNRGETRVTNDGMKRLINEYHDLEAKKFLLGRKLEVARSINAKLKGEDLHPNS